MAANDITGQRFGMLIAREKVPRPPDAVNTLRCSWWRCECKSCGGERIVPLQYLKQGTAKHCGCRSRADKARAGQIRAEHVKGKTVGKYKTPGGSNDIKLNMGSMVVECRCPTCKKVFDRLSPDWVYQRILHRQKQYFCSYSCWRADLAERKPKRAYSAAVRSKTHRFEKG